MKSVLGPMSERRIRSSLGPFWVVDDYKIYYPENVKAALGNLYNEYNRAFAPLVKKNREWAEDYQHIMQTGPCNFTVQIDMVGLDNEFLSAATDMDKQAMSKKIKRGIFEIENSIAMYQLLEQLFPENGIWRQGWRTALDEIRRKNDKPIALLAVTSQKHRAMAESEFGKQKGEELSDAEVFELSGFDRFFSPESFRMHIADNNGECKYLLFVRSSDPTDKLRKPEILVEQPLLIDPEMRRLIKANAITFNVDSPEWSVGDSRRINDTKWYMPPLGMAFPVIKEEELNIRSPEFASYLASVGVNPNDVWNGQQRLRFKPAQGAYGCYGHLRGVLTNKKLRKELRREISRRGPYMVQPEMECLTIVGENGKEYTFVDRVFYAYINDADAPTFIGGFRSLIPLDSSEAKAGRNHGSKHAVWAEIS